MARDQRRKGGVPPDQEWVPVYLNNDARVNLSTEFFLDSYVNERLMVSRAERPANGDPALRFWFDREFETSLAHSPDHLTPLSVLPLAQKLYYYLLAARTGHDLTTEGERFKIWPVGCKMKLPALLTKSRNIAGELVEHHRRYAPRGTSRLYQNVRPFLVDGMMLIEDALEFHFTCFVYDLQAVGARA